MTITTTKTLCDVTGKEVPTLTLRTVGPCLKAEHRGLQFDLSHEGAVEAIRRICASPYGSVADDAMILLRTAKLSVPSQPQTTCIEDMMGDNRKQAARECLEIVKAVLSNGDSSSRHPALLGDFITTDITKAFGL